MRGAEVASRTDLLSALNLVEIIGAQGPLNTKPITSATDQLASYIGWVYACVQILSGDVGARPYGFWLKTSEKRDEWEDVEALPAFERPNAIQTWKQLAELMAVHLGLAGKAYLHMITDRPGGPPVGFQAIPPSWVQGYKLDEAGRLMYWRLLVPGQPEKPLPPEDIVFLRWPDPTDPYGGASPVKAFALSYRMDLYARAYTGELLQNRALPTGILSSEQELTPEQADTIRERWIQRFGASRTTEGPAVLGKGAKYEQISLSIADLAFLELAQLSRDQILGIYRVPASKLGLTEDANLANSREAANSYAENALLPYLRKIQDSINVFVIPRLYATTRPSQRPWFEYESPIRRDIEAEARRSRENLLAGAIRLNEHRETLGLDPDPDGDVYYLPMGIRIVDKIEPRDPYAIAPAPVAEPPEDEDEDDEAQGNNGTRALLGPGQPQTRLTDQAFELSGLQFKTAQGTLEGKLKAASRRLFSKEAKLIIAALKDQQRAAKPIRKAIIDDVLGETAAEWFETLEDSDTESLRTGFDLLRGEVPAKYLLDWELFEQEAVQWAKARAGYAIKEIQDVTREKVGRIISDGLEAGDPIDQVAKRVSEEFNQYKGYRAESIARTETSNAVNHGKYAHAKESERRLGVAYLKTWNSVQGDRTREAHRTENISPAQTIPFDQDFVVGGEAMARPLDERGSAGNVIRCRCTLTLEVVENE